MNSRVCGLITGGLLIALAGLLCLFSSLMTPPLPVEVHQGQRVLGQGVERYVYSVPEAAALLRLELALEVEAGGLAWTLRDPAGAVRWQGRLAAGESLAETRPFDAVPGEWRLVLALDDATCQYTARWRPES